MGTITKSRRTGRGLESARPTAKAPGGREREAQSESARVRERMALLAGLTRSWRTSLAHYRQLLRVRNLQGRSGFSSSAAEVSEEEADALHITDACVERVRLLRGEEDAKGGFLRVRVDS